MRRALSDKTWQDAHGAGYRAVRSQISSAGVRWQRLRIPAQVGRHLLRREEAYPVCPELLRRLRYIGRHTGERPRGQVQPVGRRTHAAARPQDRDLR